MHLSKLRLVGFKSFVEATDFQIEPGLTGIVGPNGCGKSNLVEALRWVMGESSYKSMRASGMDDVIFAGGGDRPARNVAEVGLVLDNAARTAPAAFNESEVLEITRRIERDKGSTYRINGREVRARDVQILFADASTGARSPALVRQGQISEIIAAKPQARRRILEEAAGVAGLHTRRHEAELRLKGAEDNLSRIDDVLIQMAAQTDGLRRQARQARRYRELQAELRRMQALAILIDHEEAAREVDAARAKLAAAAAAVIEWTRAQGEAARHQAVAANALPALRDAEVEAGATLQRVVVARETIDGEERRAKGRRAEIERRIDEMTDDRARDAAAVDDAGEMLERLAAEAAQLGAKAGSDGEEDALRHALAAAAAARTETEALLAAAQAAVAEDAVGRRALEDRLREENARIARFDREAAQARQARDALRASLDPGDHLAASAETSRRAADAVAAADREAHEAERAVVAARGAEQADRAPLAEAERKAQRLATEVATLTKLLAAGGGAQWPPVAEFLRVAKGHEAAVGAAFGDDLDASSDPRAPAHWITIESRGDGPLPDGAEPMSRFVEAPPALGRRLAQIGLVSRDAGPVIRPRLAVGQTLVSREGDIWRWDGFTRAAEAPTPAARRLAERNRLAELGPVAAEAEATLTDARARAEQLRVDLSTAATHEAAARAAQHAARRAHDHSRDACAASERRLAEARARLAALDAVEAAARTSRDEAAARKTDIETAIAALPAADDLPSAVAAARRQAAEDRERETELRASLQSIARERDGRTRRLAAIATERQAWDERRERARAHGVDLDARLVEARSEREALVDAPDLFVQARRQILAEVERAETALRAASDARAAAETALAEADRQARAALDKMGAAREEKARAEARDEAAVQRLEAVVRAASAELECEPGALPALAGLEPADARPPRAEVASRLDELKGDRDRLGAVNLRADDELASIEDQRSGLDREKADLTEAIRRLRQAIGSLNKEGRDRLLAAFEIVNGHFAALFTTLFGGGKAELQLVESDDPLEAGLEILARPPGKKPQIMTLLSGGEQALTAMSLIFAVFLTNPSPICVLDEVDAPLDDANVERFCDLVDEMRRKTETRFITITHNPITMARMDRLFGVTMAEQGVSQLVSVDLAEAEVLLEAV